MITANACKHLPVQVHAGVLFCILTLYYRYIYDRYNILRIPFKNKVCYNSLTNDIMGGYCGKQ